MLNKEEFDKYLKERYEDQINWYSEKAIHFKRLYKFFQWMVIVLSASIPVLILIVPVEKQLITVAISVVLTISTSALKTFKFQENWISYRILSETLKKERYFYDAELGDYANCDDKKSLFVERVESLVSRENSLWIINHMKKEKSYVEKE